jgi:hypothetical protein
MILAGIIHRRGRRERGGETTAGSYFPNSARNGAAACFEPFSPHPSFLRVLHDLCGKIELFELRQAAMRVDSTETEERESSLPKRRRDGLPRGPPWRVNDAD